VSLALVAAFAFVFLVGVLVGAGIAITRQQRIERKLAVERIEQRYEAYRERVRQQEDSTDA
jgi:protein-S-isoprenylcysteine O-methyltransferase Ste14